MALRYLLVLIILAILVGFSVEVDQGISSDGSGQLHTLCKTNIKADTVTPENLNTTSGNVSTCEDDCRQTYTPADGTVNSLYSALYGWVLNISCNRGYELKGRASIICYEDIETKEFPVCEKHDNYTIYDIVLPLPVYDVVYPESSADLYKTLMAMDVLDYQQMRHKVKDFSLSGAFRHVMIKPGTIYTTIVTCSDVDGMKDEQEPKSIEGERYRAIMALLFQQTSVGVPNKRNMFYMHVSGAYRHVMIKPTNVEWSTYRYNDVSLPLTLSDVDKMKGEQEPKSIEDFIVDWSSIRIALITTAVSVIFVLVVILYVIFRCIRPKTIIHYDQRTHHIRSAAPLLNICNEAEPSSIPLGAYTYTCVVTPLHNGSDNPDDDVSYAEQQVMEYVQSDGGLPYSPCGRRSNIEVVTPLHAADDHKNDDVSASAQSEQGGSGNGRDETGAHSPNEENVDTTISQIENNSKTRPGGENIEVILYNIFRHWKSINKTGRLSEIETALEHSHHEHVISYLNDNIYKFYKPDELIEQNTNLKIQELSDIPELEYRVRPKRHNIALRLDDNGCNNETGPFIQEPDLDVSYNQEAVPVVPYQRTSAKIVPYTRTPAPSVPYAGTQDHIIPHPETIVTLNYRFADTDRFRFRRGKRFNVTKRKYGTHSFQRPRKHIQFKPRTRHAARSTSKVQFSKKKTTIQGSSVHALSDRDKMCIDLLLRILDFDTQKLLNAMEYNLLMKYIVFKSKNAMFLLEMDALSGIRFEDYKMCQHVLMPQNGALHIINSGGLTVPIKDDLWKLIETYVHRARAEVVARVPNSDEHYLFLTYGGKQVTHDYIHMYGTTTTEAELDLDHGRRSIAVGTEDIQASTSKAEDRKVVVCDCKRRLPISRNTTHAKRPNKVGLETVNDQQHKRRFFCGRQTVTIENIFRKEIRQGTVKEITVLTKCHDCAELREVFALQPNDVSKILVKKITDRVRCFIRNKKH